MAVAALVLGIIGTIFSIFPGFGYMVGIPLSLIALILGIVGRKNAKTNNLPTGSATAGMVLGIVGLAVGILMFVACAMCAKKLNDAANDPKAQQEWNEAFKKALEESAKQQPPSGGTPAPAPAAPAK